MAQACTTSAAIASMALAGLFIVFAALAFAEPAFVVAAAVAFACFFGELKLKAFFCLDDLGEDAICFLDDDLGEVAILGRRKEATKKIYYLVPSVVWSGQKVVWMWVALGFNIP